MTRIIAAILFFLFDTGTTFNVILFANHPAKQYAIRAACFGILTTFSALVAFSKAPRKL